MTEEKKESWMEEVSGLPDNLVQTSFVEDSPEEKKEIEELLQKLEEERKSRQPIRRWKWKKDGIKLATIFLFCFEFVIIWMCIYFFGSHCVQGINLSLINSFSITFLLFLLKRWVKD